LWSIGVLMFELIVGEAPFSWTPGFNTWPRKEQTEKQLYRRIKNVDVDFPDYFSSQGRKFCKSLLQKVPGDRLKLTEFTKQTWLKHYLKKRKAKEIFNLPLSSF